jgi:hypothetical protein
MEWRSRLWGEALEKQGVKNMDLARVRLRHWKEGRAVKMSVRADEVFLIIYLYWEWIAGFADLF